MASHIVKSAIEVAKKEAAKTAVDQFVSVSIYHTITASI